MNKTIGIIGGGASGMTAAIIAAKNNANVILFEANERLGKKILATGNGKCNLDNFDMGFDKYYSSDEALMKKLLGQYNTEDVLSFFEKLGLLTTEKNGYIYPLSEQAASVLDVLRYEVERNPHIKVCLECKINKIEKGKNGFVIADNQKRYSCDAVILACGGKASPKTGSDGSGYDLAKMTGHRLIPVVPALVQLKCKEDWFKTVAGVRVEAAIKVKHGNENIRERGELQLTDYGISGIPVFQISRQVNYILRDQKEIKVEIDFLPRYSKEEWMEMAQTSREMLKNCSTAEEYFSGLLNKKIMSLILKLCGIKLSENPKEINKSKIQKVFEMCKAFTVTVNGSNSFDNAQVCAGGVALNELTDHLESRKMPGLFMVGELIDIDGKCGGYNLHWAWCSGMIAGSAVTMEKKC